MIEHAVPANIFESLAQNDVLQMVVFFFLFGAACSAIGAKAQPVVHFAGAVAEVMFRYTKYVMYLAPFGVAAAIAVTVASKGIGVLFGLGKLVGALYLALVLFIVLVLLPTLVLARVPLARFWRAVRQPFLIAFSTASSEAAFPLALENLERFGVPRHIAGFVLPTGYSFNLTGTALYLSLASVFIAQAAGIHMPLGAQITIMLTLMLTSKGAAGVPRAGLVLLAVLGAEQIRHGLASVLNEQLAGELQHIVIGHLLAGLHVGRGPGGSPRLVRFKALGVAIVDDLLKFMCFVGHDLRIADDHAAVKRLLSPCGR